LYPKRPIQDHPTAHRCVVGAPDTTLGLPITYQRSESALAI